MTQCCSIIKVAHRCTNTAVKGSKHCDVHRGAAKKAYKKYKQSHTIVEDYDHKATVALDNTRYLLRYYSILNKSYIGRLNHQLFSFAKETRDNGHTYQINLLKSKMYEVEDRLAVLFSMKDFSDNNTNMSGNISSDDTESCEEEQPVVYNIEIMRETRYKLERETLQILDKYTLEHQEDVKTQSLIEDKICDRLAALCPFTWNIGISIHALIKAIVKCDQLGYFNNQYLPCKLATEIHNPANVFDPSWKHNNFKGVYSTNLLRRVYAHMLFHGNKIACLVTDIYCYILCCGGSAVFQFPFKILWDGCKRRLVMSLYIRYDSKMPQRLRQLDKMKRAAYKNNPKVFNCTSTLISMVIPLGCIKGYSTSSSSTSDAYSQPALTIYI